MPRPLNRRVCDAAAIALVAAALVAPAAAAPDLLPPEQAFAFSARGLDASTVEARFAIAKGYYLYRDKLTFSVEPSPLGAAPSFPAGLWKEDAFFGRVETYRNEVVVRLPLAAAAAGSRVTVKAESQGCADLGVCYPPQVQQVTFAMPAPGAGPGDLVDAAPKKAWFR